MASSRDWAEGHRGPAARGGAAYLHVEFSQLPLKHRWVGREGHRANICREEREDQVSLDPQKHSPRGLGQQLYDVPPSEGGGAEAWTSETSTNEEVVGEQLPGLPGSDLEGRSGHLALCPLQTGPRAPGEQRDGAGGKPPVPPPDPQLPIFCDYDSPRNLPSTSPPSPASAGREFWEDKETEN